MYIFQIILPILCSLPTFVVCSGIRGEVIRAKETLDTIYESENNIRGLQQESAPTLPPTEGPWCLEKRYEGLLQLSWKDRRFALSSSMGYDFPSWNFVVENPIESRSFDDPLTSDATRQALIEFGYDEDMFDCCVNHYSNYDWDELLIDDGLEQISALEMLGWTRETHGSNNASLWPATEFMTWDELNVTQREMAKSKLCYTNETWNEVPLYDWPSDASFPDFW